MSPSPATIRRCVAAALLQLAALGPAAAQGQPQDLPTMALSAGMHAIRAQVAITPIQRQIGLMFRREMPQNEGMLFVFESPTRHCFWMRNTLIPLSIAFLRDDGTIANLDEMQPHSENSHCSVEPVRFALEMNKGWFSRRGIKPGMKISGPPFAKTP